MTRDILKPAVFIGLFALPFVPFLVSSSLFFPFITTKAFTWRIIVEIVFAAWIPLALLDQEYRPKRSAILYALLAFLAVIGLADLLGIAPVKSFWSNAERMEGYITMLHLGAFFLVISSVFNEVNWKRWWNTTLAASGLMVVYCLFQLAGAITINQGGVRVDGTLGNASYLAGYMLFHIFLAILMMWRSRKDASAKWIYGLLIAGQLFILYHTATRGAILGLLGGLLLLALLNIRNKKESGLRRASIGIVIGLVVLVGGFFAFKNSAFVQNSPVLSRFSSISTEELKSGGRAFIWPMAVKGIEERPILGWGQENFNYVFQEHYDPAMYALEPWFDRAHNIFLDWAIAGGVIGLLAYLSLYAALLYKLWRSGSFDYTEKTIITGLVAGYFFHNFFVFDNLVSYMLFFALLAYIQARSEGKIILENKDIAERHVRTIALPIAGILLLLTLYFANLKPIAANSSVLDALRNMQRGDMQAAVKDFEKAYGGARLGRPEVAEQIATNSIQILQSNMPIGERNKFFQFSRQAVEGQAGIFADDARYQLIAGTFLSRTGQFDDSVEYFKKAEELMPNKQVMYFGLGGAYLREENYADALEQFKTAYNLAPEYEEAKIIYLTGAIYAGDTALEEKLLSEFPAEKILNNDRILNAYVSAGKPNRAIVILNSMRVKYPQYGEKIDARIKEIQESAAR